MRISIIVAMANDGLIGAGGRLPWHLPGDLKMFRKLTWGKPIVMGRKTFESIGRPLPGRCNVVLTHREDFQAEGCLAGHSLAGVLNLARGKARDEIMVIGGAEVFRQALPLCDRLYLTRVSGSFQGDTFFPMEEMRELEWREVETREFQADESNPHPYRFSILDRTPPTL